MPDLVITNARLVPLESPTPPALVDIVIEGSLISDVSSTVQFPGRHAVDSAENRTVGADEVIDADGRWLIPGLWDEHVHFDHWASARNRIDLSGASSAAEAAAIMAAASGAADGVLIGRSYRDALWPDSPDRRLLDDLFPERPVVLVSADLHSCWLNSAALMRFGVGDHPTGLLVEDDGFAILTQLDAPDPRDGDRWALEAARLAAARGVVGIHDLEMGYNLDGWRRRMAAGFDVLRVDSGIYADGLDRAEADGAATGTAFGPLLSVGCFKVITDGSLGTRTAFCVDPYPGTDDHGILTVPPTELRGLLTRATALGLVPAVHAIGDEANRLALDTMIDLGTGGRIEHAQLLLDDDLPRFAAGGILASVQPEHAMDDRDIAERYWAGRTGRAFVLRALLDAGARLAFGSDAPVAPLDPWLAIAAAVTRSRDAREPWHPEQALTATEALAASVRTRIAAGRPADLVLLDADPLSDASVLRDMPVAATLLGGRFTHRNL